jgi:hypothetical protein
LKQKKKAMMEKSDKEKMDKKKKLFLDILNPKYL